MRPGIAVVLSLAIIVLTSHAPAAQSGALLQNGSFDVTQNGRPIGWLVDGGSFESVSEPVAEPGLAARLAPLGAALSARAVQNVTLQPGGAYRLSAKVLVNDSDVQFVRLDITWDGDSASSKPFSAIGPNYVTLQASQLTLSCDAHDVQVALVLRRSSTTQAAAVFIDDVVLESVGQVPCPTATPPPTLPPGQPPSASATPQPDETAAAGIGPLRNSGFEQVEDGALVAWRDHGGALTRVANPVHGGSFAGAFFSKKRPIPPL